MFEKIVSLKAEAEKKLLLAKAKVEVYDEILEAIKDSEVVASPEKDNALVEELSVNSETSDII